MYFNKQDATVVARMISKSSTVEEFASHCEGNYFDGYSFINGKVCFEDYFVPEVCMAVARIHYALAKYKHSNYGKLKDKSRYLAERSACVYHNGNAIWFPSCIFDFENNTYDTEGVPHTVFDCVLKHMTDEHIRDRILHCFSAGVKRVFAIDVYRKSVVMYRAEDCVAQKLDYVQLDDIGLKFKSAELFRDVESVEDRTSITLECCGLGEHCRDNIYWAISTIIKHCDGVFNDALVDCFECELTDLSESVSDVYDIGTLEDVRNACKAFLEKYEELTRESQKQNNLLVSPSLERLLNIVDTREHISIALHVVNDILFYAGVRIDNNASENVSCFFEDCMGKDNYSEHLWDGVDVHTLTGVFDADMCNSLSEYNDDLCALYREMMVDQAPVECSITTSNPNSAINKIQLE